MAETQRRPGYRHVQLACVLLLVLSILPLTSVTRAATDLEVGGTAVVSNTGGDAIRVRDEGSTSGDIVGRVYEGNVVDVISGPVEADDGSFWYEIETSSLSGFVSAEFLESQAAEEEEETPTPPANANASTSSSVRLREGAGTNFDIILNIPGSARITVTGAASNGFLPVIYNGNEGWAAAQYIELDDSSDDDDDAPVSPAATNAATTDSLRLRSGAGTSFSTILTMPNGARITVTGSASNGFLPVSYNSSSGWASAQYIRLDGGGDDTNPSDTGPATTTSALNLRNGPSTNNTVLKVMPVGSVVERLGEESNGFLKVTHQGTTGWASGTYLRAGGGGDDDDEVVGTARTTSALNLRSGPSTSNTPLLVMPSGATVDLFDSTSGGFQKVRYNGTVGWAHTDYLSTGDDDDDDPGEPVGTMFTTTALNLRQQPNTDATILRVMPAGSEVGILGDPQSGFYPVRFGSTDGWAFGDYLREPGGGGGGGSSNIIWPVNGGSWRIIQGYNGGTHQNRSASAQYYYALDIGRVDGNTARQSVYAPASGTVVWNDPNSGGILIDMGNGYGIAMFHCTFDSGWGRGDSVSQGDYLGYVSPPGGNGYAVVSHIDMTLWRTPSGGSSPRYAAPFSGGNAIEGQSFPDIGTSNMHGGTVFFP